MMSSQTNEQAFESLIEKALEGNPYIHIHAQLVTR